MLLKDYREPFLSFELTHIRCGSVRDNPHSFVSFGIAEILRFPKLSIYSEVFLLKTFLQHVELWKL